jgi:hypothetical protein
MMTLSREAETGMQRLVFIALMALALSACETTPTLYQPLSGDTHVGYSETPIEQDRWRVVFAGGPGADPNHVADLALRRAAELTLAHGYDWFRVTERSAERRGGGGPYLSIGGGSAGFGGGAAVGVGVGTGFDLSGGPRVIETLEILMGRGAAPHDPDAYDAHSVVRSLSAV